LEANTLFCSVLFHGLHDPFFRKIVSELHIIISPHFKFSIKILLIFKELLSGWFYQFDLIDASAPMRLAVTCRANFYRWLFAFVPLQRIRGVQHRLLCSAAHAD
jgi:hypothetical protein